MTRKGCRTVGPVSWNILRILRSRPGRSVSRKYMMEQLYGYGDSPESNCLSVMILNLRRKLEGTPYRIENTRGHGYRLEMEGEHEWGAR